jgi:hypothetical protein
MFLLDTNMVSELRKVSSGKADRNFAERVLPVNTAVARRSAALHPRQFYSDWCVLAEPMGQFAGLTF